MRPVSILWVLLLCGPMHAHGEDAAPPLRLVDGESQLYVVRRGWHMEVGFAAAALTPPLATVVEQFPGVRYVFFGFGDRRYLMAKHRHGPVLLAALWPGPALILATALTAAPASAFGLEHTVVLEVSRAQLAAAQAFVAQSLGAPGSPYGGEVDVVAAGPYEGSLYVSARGTYSALHTCNTWAAEVLARAGLPVHSSGVVFAGQVWKQTLALRAQ